MTTDNGISILKKYSILKEVPSKHNGITISTKKPVSFFDRVKLHKLGWKVNSGNNIFFLDNLMKDSENEDHYKRFS
jgi:hypothetical protein